MQLSAMVQKAQALIKDGIKIVFASESYPNSSGYVYSVCSDVPRSVYGAVAVIGDATVYSDVTLSTKLDTKNFTPTRIKDEYFACAAFPKVSYDKETGELSVTMDKYRAGEYLAIAFSGVLKDFKQIGDISVTTSGATLSSDKGTIAIDTPLSLTRSGYTVSYDINGGTGIVPTDEIVVQKRIFHSLGTLDGY